MNTDDKDKREARGTAAAIVGALVLLVMAGALMLTLIGGIGSVFAAGLGLKGAAIIAFFITIIVLVLFTLAAGDGLLGELQYILGGFFSFFIILWLMIAWIF